MCLCCFTDLSASVRWRVNVQSSHSLNHQLVFNCCIFYYQNSIFRGLQAASRCLPATQQVRPADCKILMHTHRYTQRQRSHKLWIYLCVMHPCFFTSSILALLHSLWFSPALHLLSHSQGCQKHIKQFLFSLPICKIVFPQAELQAVKNVWRTCQRKSSLKYIKFCHHHSHTHGWFPLFCGTQWKKFWSTATQLFSIQLNWTVIYAVKLQIGQKSTWENINFYLFH